MKQGIAVASVLMVMVLTLLLTVEPAEAQVTILRVGLHGDYDDIQDAIDVVVSGDDTEIRVEGGTYLENLEIDAAFAAGTLALLGGWDMTFTNRVFPPQNTIIDGNQAGRVIRAFGNAGSLVIDGFTITNGLSANAGGGIDIDPSGDADVTLENVRIIGNTATEAGGTGGGGLYVELSSTQHLEVLNCRIRDNLASSTGGGVVAGGGFRIRAISDSSFLIQGCEIDDNTAQSTGQVLGAGLSAYLQDNAQGEILDNSIVENIADSTDVWVSGVDFRIQHSCTLNVERTAVAMNTAIGGGTAPQLYSSNADASSLRMSDSIIGLGDQDGMDIRGGGTSTVNLVNLTVIDNPGNGIMMGQFESATVTLYNTISFGNLVDFSIINGSVDTGSNLIGVDPLFVNPLGLDYHLGLGSSAENAGDNSPPGGLGLLDFGGDPRIKDGTVDIGSYEGIAEIFSDGFESGLTTNWSNSSP